MSSKKPPPWAGLSELVRPMTGAVLIADMKWITGCRNNQDLERLLDAARLKKTRGGAYKYTDRYSRYQRGDDLPGHETVERGKAATGCPELFRAIERVKLWWMLVPTPEGYFEIRDTLKTLSEDVRRVVFSSRAPRDGEPRRRRRDDRAMYEELVRINSVDALTALAAFGLELYFSSDRRGRLSRSDRLFVRKIVDAACAIFVRLTVFTPFFEAQESVFEYLTSWQGAIDAYPHSLINLREADARRFTSDARELLNFVGDVGLIGSTFHEQMELVYWFHTSKRQQHTLEQVRHLRYEIGVKGSVVRLRPSSPLYALLRRIRHKAVRTGRSIVLPRRLRSRQKFVFANALGPVAVPVVEPGTPTDHHRFTDSTVRSERSEKPSEVVNSVRRVQLRKPGRMTTKTDDD